MQSIEETKAWIHFSWVSERDVLHNPGEIRLGAFAAFIHWTFRRPKSKITMRSEPWEILFLQEQLSVSNCIIEAPGSHFHYINTFGVSRDKSDASLFPLKPSLSCPGSGLEIPPSSPPNPEVIAKQQAAFQHGLTPISQTPKWGVYVDSIQIADSKFPCGLALLRMDQKIITSFTWQRSPQQF